MKIFNTLFGFKGASARNHVSGRDGYSTEINKLFESLESLNMEIDIYLLQAKRREFGDVKVSHRLRSFHDELDRIRSSYFKQSARGDLGTKLLSEIDDARMKMREFPDVVLGKNNKFIKWEESADEVSSDLTDEDLILLNAFGDEERDSNVRSLHNRPAWLRNTLSRYDVACLKWQNYMINQKAKNAPRRREIDKPERGWW